MIDYSYSELEESDIKRVFESKEASKYRVIDREATYFYAECEDEPDMFMNHLKVAVYETQHNILSDEMKADFIQYADRWDKGEFQPDLMPGDIPLIQKDIDFVRKMIGGHCTDHEAARQPCQKQTNTHRKEENR